MAYIQGLTHSMAKALRESTVPDLELGTVAYWHMVQIGEILRDDSDELAVYESTRQGRARDVTVSAIHPTYDETRVLCSFTP